MKSIQKNISIFLWGAVLVHLMLPTISLRAEGTEQLDVLQGIDSETVVKVEVNEGEILRFCSSDDGQEDLPVFDQNSNLVHLHSRPTRNFSDDFSNQLENFFDQAGQDLTGDALTNFNETFDPIDENNKCLRAELAIQFQASEFGAELTQFVDPRYADFSCRGGDVENFPTTLLYPPSSLVPGASCDSSDDCPSLGDVGGGDGVCIDQEYRLRVEFVGIIFPGRAPSGNHLCAYNFWTVVARDDRDRLVPENGRTNGYCSAEVYVEGEGVGRTVIPGPRDYFEIEANETGVWQIDFIGEPETSTYQGPAGPPVLGSLGAVRASQQNGSSTLFFDVQVLPGVDMEPALGRVFSEKWGLNSHNENFLPSPSLFVLSQNPDGLRVFSARFSQWQGLRYSVIASSTNIEGLEGIGQSFCLFDDPENVGRCLTGREGLDLMLNPRPIPFDLPIYLNFPDIDLADLAPASALTNPTSQTSNGDNILVVGGDADENQIVVSFDSAADSLAALVIDSNQDDLLNARDDLFFIGNTFAGENQIVFDGTDVEGNPLEPGCYSFSLEVMERSQLPIHLPFEDVENRNLIPNGDGGRNVEDNSRGFVVREARSRDDAESLPVRMYWNDTNVRAEEQLVFEDDVLETPDLGSLIYDDEGLGEPQKRVWYEERRDLGEGLFDNVSLIMDTWFYSGSVRAKEFSCASCEGGVTSQIIIAESADNLPACALPEEEELGGAGGMPMGGMGGEAIQGGRGGAEPVGGAGPVGGQQPVGGAEPMGGAVVGGEESLGGQSSGGQLAEGTGGDAELGGMVDSGGDAEGLAGELGGGAEMIGGSAAQGGSGGEAVQEGSAQGGSAQGGMGGEPLAMDPGGQNNPGGQENLGGENVIAPPLGGIAPMGGIEIVGGVEEPVGGQITGGQNVAGQMVIAGMPGEAGGEIALGGVSVQGGIEPVGGAVAGDESQVAGAEIPAAGEEAIAGEGGTMVAQAGGQSSIGGSDGGTQAEGGAEPLTELPPSDVNSAIGCSCKVATTSNSSSANPILGLFLFAGLLFYKRQKRS